MMNALFRLFLSVHTTLYRISGGRLGGTMGGNQILLLHSIGRKSGKKYITPLVYFRSGEDYVIVASAGGAERNPGWYHNLRSNPFTKIQVMGDVIPVTAEMAEGDKRDALWQMIISQGSQFAGYQEKTERKIPVFVLHSQ